MVEGLVYIHRHGNLWGPGDLHQQGETVIARQVITGLSGNAVVLVLNKAQERHPILRCHLYNFAHRSLGDQLRHGGNDGDGGSQLNQLP